MLNVIKDFNTTSNITPYLGLGVGAARVDTRVATLYQTPGGAQANGFDDTDTSFAWNALAGFGIKLGPQLTVDLGYTYTDAQQLAYTGVDGQYEKLLERARDQRGRPLAGCGSAAPGPAAAPASAASASAAPPAASASAAAAHPGAAAGWRLARPSRRRSWCTSSGIVPTSPRPTAIRSTRLCPVRSRTAARSR